MSKPAPYHDKVNGTYIIQGTIQNGKTQIVSVKTECQEKQKIYQKEIIPKTELIKINFRNYFSNSIDNSLKNNTKKKLIYRYAKI